MTNLGIFTAGQSVFYAGNFHGATGALADPSPVFARLKNPDGSWSDLDAPAKQDSKTGHFGGSVDTTGLAEGQYAIRLCGTVGTTSAAAEFFFQIKKISLFDPAVEVMEDNGTRSFTYKEAMRLIFAFLVGERGGGGYAGDKTFKVPGGQKTRVTMKTDQAGNSTAAHTLDPQDA